MTKTVKLSSLANEFHRLGTDRTLALVRIAGVTAVELSEFYDLRPSEWKKLFDKNGITEVFISVPWALCRTRFDLCVSFVRILKPKALAADFTEREICFFRAFKKLALARARTEKLGTVFAVRTQSADLELTAPLPPEIAELPRLDGLCEFTEIDAAAAFAVLAAEEAEFRAKRLAAREAAESRRAARKAAEAVAAEIVPTEA
jgi:hypothetical protein